MSWVEKVIWLKCLNLSNEFIWLHPATRWSVLTAKHSGTRSLFDFKFWRNKMLEDFTFINQSFHWSLGLDCKCLWVWFMSWWRFRFSETLFIDVIVTWRFSLWIIIFSFTTFQPSSFSQKMDSNVSLQTTNSSHTNPVTLSFYLFTLLFLLLTPFALTKSSAKWNYKFTLFNSFKNFQVIKKLLKVKGLFYYSLWLKNIYNQHLNVYENELNKVTLVYFISNLMWN